MKLINGDKLERHLDYLIKRDNQFAKMCDGDDDYSRQRKYCFEVDALAYQLCKSVMDYYLVKDVQPVNQWISVDDRLPNIGERVFVYIPRPDNHYNTEIAYISKGNDDYPYWVLRERSQFYSTRFHYVTHWQPLPESPKDGDAKK